VEVRKMAQRRIDTSSQVPFILFLAGLIGLLSGFVSFQMYPSKTTVAYSVLGTGGGLLLLAFIISPTLLKDLFTSRKSWLWVNDALLVIAFIGIGVLLTHIAFRRNYRYDFTRDQLFSISDSTIKLLGKLDKDVKITAFFPVGAVETGMMDDLIKEYRRHTDRLQFSMVDPRRDPLTCRAMGVNNMGTVVVQCQSSRKDIFQNEIFIMPNPYARQAETPKFQGEQALTSAIMNVTAGTRRKVQFVKGHEEPGLSSFNPQGFAGIQKYLEKENFVVSEVNLADGIGTDTQIVGIISPKKSFHPSEIQALKDFCVNRKGQLLVTMDPESKSPEFEAFLTETYGVLFNSEIIINPARVSNSPVVIIPTYQFHPIVKDQLEKNSGCVMQMCRGITFEAKDAWKATPFLTSGDGPFGKRKMDEVMSGKIDFNPQTDVRGPLNLGVAFEPKGPASGSRAVFFGDSDFASNNMLQYQGNADLMVNTVNWLAGQDDKIAIHAKTVEFSPVVLDKEAANRILILSVVVSPLLVIMIGAGVWWSRRRV